MDYKELLFKYMRLVSSEESVTFVECINERIIFTEEEEKELKKMAETIYNEG